MKNLVIIVLLLFPLLVSAQDQTVIEKNSTPGDVHLKLIEKDATDYARIEFHTEPPGGIIPVNSNGKFQIAAKSYDPSDALKEFNFWYALHSSNSGKNLLSLKADGSIFMGRSDLSVTLVGVAGSTLHGSTQAQNDAFSLFSNGAFVVDLNEDDSGSSTSFIVRDGEDENLLVLQDDGNMTIRGALTQNSNRNRKHNIKPVDYHSILQKISDLDITQWSYLNEDVSHLGPMAQDFYASFGLGGTNLGICAIDADGVALAAIKALKQENDQLAERLFLLEQRMPNNKISE